MDVSNHPSVTADESARRFAQILDETEIDLLQVRTEPETRGDRRC